MKQEGYDVTGITLKLYDDTKKIAKEDNVAQAKIFLMQKSFRKTNINHEILYYQKKFKSEVIDSFINSYVSGEKLIPVFNVINSKILRSFMQKI